MYILIHFRIPANIPELAQFWHLTACLQGCAFNTDICVVLGICKAIDDKQCIGFRDPLSTLLQEMAWRQIDANPFLESMLILDILQS